MSTVGRQDVQGAQLASGFLGVALRRSVRCECVTFILREITGFFSTGHDQNGEVSMHPLNIRSGRLSRIEPRWIATTRVRPYSQLRAGPGLVY